MIYFLLFNALFSNILSDFISKLTKESTVLKELSSKYSSVSELNNAIYGKYDILFYSDLNYSNQDGGITGNFFLDNTETSSFEFGLKKKFHYGITADLNHSLSNTNITSGIIGNKGTYLPVITTSLNFDLLANFLGKKDQIEINNSEINNKKNDIDLKNQIDLYYLNVLTRYLQTKTIKDQIVVANTLLKSSKDLLKVVKRKYRIGSTERRNLIFAETNNKSSIETVLNAKRSYNEAVSLLSALCGFELEPFLDEVINTDYINSLIKKISKYDFNNSNLISKNFEIEIAKNELKFNKFNLLPELSLRGSYSFGGIDESFSSSYDAFPNKGSFVGLSFVWDIQNKSAKSLKKSSEFYLEALEFSFLNLGFSVDKELSFLKKNLALYKEQSIITQDKLLKNKERYKLELKAFEFGHTTMTAVIDAQQSLALSEAEVNSIKYEILINVLNTAYKKGILKELLI